MGHWLVNYISFPNTVLSQTLTLNHADTFLLPSRDRSSAPSRDRGDKVTSQWLCMTSLAVWRGSDGLSGCRMTSSSLRSSGDFSLQRDSRWNANKFTRVRKVAIALLVKAVTNHAEVRDSIPSMDVGKEPDSEIFAPLPDASVYGEYLKYHCKPFIFARWEWHKNKCLKPVSVWGIWTTAQSNSSRPLNEYQLTRDRKGSRIGQSIINKMMIIMRDATPWTCLHMPVAVVYDNNDKSKKHKKHRRY